MPASCGGSSGLRDRRRRRGRGGGDEALKNGGQGRILAGVLQFLPRDRSEGVWLAPPVGDRILRQGENRWTKVGACLVFLKLIIPSLHLQWRPSPPCLPIASAKTIQ